MRKALPVFQFGEVLPLLALGLSGSNLANGLRLCAGTRPEYWGLGGLETSMSGPGRLRQQGEH